MVKCFTIKETEDNGKGGTDGSKEEEREKATL